MDYCGTSKEHPSNFAVAVKSHISNRFLEKFFFPPSLNGRCRLQLWGTCIAAPHFVFCGYSNFGTTRLRVGTTEKGRGKDGNAFLMLIPSVCIQGEMAFDVFKTS
ncbi:hypothetical protein CDAR_71741 [Caerostris darwini]|uniref:Uncharacterized protein n=1 Tax=Caerostris darwini TaxID=1538125 RepID=A0AAV4TJS0_9ARAC|nr:hypothetical protein CDAR_71741 [Caerostris darwini]